MSAKLENLMRQLEARFGERVRLSLALSEVTLEVAASDYKEVMLALRDLPEFSFDQLTDLCGVDYATYVGDYRPAGRFAVVTHLLSMPTNRRLRVRVFAPDAALPVVDSVSAIWSAADWFEREAFDLFGILFEGHLDLRRILTDYGFVGHPFRKDFPISGQVEMRYDAEAGRVIYQPVSIAPRENTPRIRREVGYGDVEHG